MLEQGVDERRDGCTLRQNDQATEHGHHYEDRQQPELLPHYQKRQKLDKEGFHGPLKIDC
jgi:hypothetical protein